MTALLARPRDYGMIPESERVKRLNASEWERYQKGLMLELILGDTSSRLHLDCYPGDSRITRSGEYVRDREITALWITSTERRTASRQNEFEALNALVADLLPPRTKMCIGEGCPCGGVPQTLDNFRKREADRTPLRPYCKLYRRMLDKLPPFVINGVRQKTPRGTRRRA